jgi:hypothetical protein
VTNTVVFIKIIIVIFPVCKVIRNVTNRRIFM